MMLTEHNNVITLTFLVMNKIKKSYLMIRPMHDGN